MTLGRTTNINQDPRQRVGVSRLSLSAWAGLVSPRTGLKGPTSVIEDPILFNPVMPWTRVGGACKMETSPLPINGPG